MVVMKAPPCNKAIFDFFHDRFFGIFEHTFYNFFETVIRHSFLSRVQKLLSIKLVVSTYQMKKQKL